MAKNLTWFQARALTRQAGAVRRDAWRRWITRGTALYFTTQVVENVTQHYVVQTAEFTGTDRLATDWTDEPWTDPTTGSPVSPPSGSQSPTPSGGAGNLGSISNPPGSGALNFSGSGYGGGGSGASTPTPPKPPTPNNQPDNQTPRVTVSWNGEEGKVGTDQFTDSDEAKGCYPEPPDHEVTIKFTITLVGGPAKYGTMRYRLGTGTWHPAGAWAPGMQQSFDIPNVTQTQGGTQTVTAEFTNDTATYSGAGTLDFPPSCTPSFVWHLDYHQVDDTTASVSGTVQILGGVKGSYDYSISGGNSDPGQINQSGKASRGDVININAQTLPSSHLISDSVNVGLQWSAPNGPFTSGSAATKTF